jgi:GTPase
MNKSCKIVTFLDLCGHEKYLKTTMYGMVSMAPDYALLAIGSNMGVARMTKEHLGLTLAL